MGWLSICRTNEGELKQVRVGGVGQLTVESERSENRCVDG